MVYLYVPVSSIDSSISTCVSKHSSSTLSCRMLRVRYLSRPNSILIPVVHNYGLLISWFIIIIIIILVDLRPEDLYHACVCVSLGVITYNNHLLHLPRAGSRRRIKNYYYYLIFMFAPCINSIEALFIIPTDAHNYKIIGMLKQLKFRQLLQHISVHAGTIIRELYRA
jgi:hypothetical protein